MFGYKNADGVWVSQNVKVPAGVVRGPGYWMLHAFNQGFYVDHKSTRWGNEGEVFLGWSKVKGNATHFPWRHFLQIGYYYDLHRRPWPRIRVRMKGRR